MIKKAIIGSVAAVVVAGLFLGRDAASYIGTSVGWVKDSVKHSVPIEFEIERARKMVENLVPDIRRNIHVIVKEEVEISRLERQIAQLSESLDVQKTHVLRLKNDLNSGGMVFQYASQSYSRGEVKTDLANRFERYQTNDATLANLRKIKDARQRSLEGARSKLANMEAQKKQLEVKVAQLGSRLKIAEAAATTCDYQFDNSRLARVKNLIADINTRLEVAERLSNTQGTRIDSIPLDEEVSEDIVDEVANYFDEGADVEQVAQAQTEE